MKKIMQISSAVSLATLVSLPASAAITLYEKEGTTFTTDVLLNTFYVSSKNDVNDKQQSRLKIGFLPNILGFNFTTETDSGLTIGGRTSFWTSSSDSRRQNTDANGNITGIQSEDNLTDGHIDTRQVYGTIGGGFGEILFGKDFGLFGRSNILQDQMLLGFGNNGLFVENDFVSYGNIGTGYLYPVPTSQLTWRSKDLFGKFGAAVGLFDPEKLADNGNSEETLPRIEGEFTYDFGVGNAWTGFTWQESEGLATDQEIESKGVSFGVSFNVAGFTVTASGYDGEGLGALVNTTQVLGGSIIDSAGDERDTSGYLVQAAYKIGRERFVVSYGHGEIDAGDGETEKFYESDTTSISWFHDLTKSGNAKLVVDINNSEVETGGNDLADVDTLAVGFVLTL